MTLPEHRIGDKGQRYEIRCFGYPEDGQNTIGWANRLPGAINMAEAIVLAPAAKDSWVVDRKEGYKVKWRKSANRTGQREEDG